MKLLRKVKNTQISFLGIAIIIQILLWCGHFIGVFNDYDSILIIFLMMALVLDVIIGIVIMTNFMSREFVVYYRELPEEKRQQLDKQIMSADSKQNVFFTSDAVINVNFLTLKVLPYENIISVKNLGKKVLIIENNNMADAINVPADGSAEKMIKEIITRNTKIEIVS